MKNSNAKPFTVWVLIFLLTFLSIGALVSGVMLILAPDGSLLNMPVSVMQGAPFDSFLIPGCILFIFLGIYPAVIIYGLLKRPEWKWAGMVNPFKRFHWSWAGSLAAAAIVFTWLTVELIWVEFFTLHAIYYTVGTLIAVFAVIPGVRGYLKEKLPAAK